MSSVETRVRVSRYVLDCKKRLTHVPILIGNKRFSSNKIQRIFLRGQIDRLEFNA